MYIFSFFFGNLFYSFRSFFQHFRALVASAYVAHGCCICTFQWLRVFYSSTFILPFSILFAPQFNIKEAGNPSINWRELHSFFFPSLYIIYILVSNTPTIAKMKFSTAVIAAAAVAAPAVAEYTNSTVTDIHTTVVTITSCSDNKCTEVPVTTGLTTVTEEDTIYTTYCPLTDVTTYTASEIQTTVVTITSCADDKCHESEVTTGVTTVTEEDTVYTTYCPLTSAAPVETTTPTTAAPVETTTSAAPVESTTPATVAPVESTTSAAPSTVAAVSTAANAANAFAAPAVGAALLAGLSFLY